MCECLKVCIGKVLRSRETCEKLLRSYTHIDHRQKRQGIESNKMPAKSISTTPTQHLSPYDFHPYLAVWK